jgi:DNA-directed RNA polymerase subunit RPC12/RpoP
MADITSYPAQVTAGSYGARFRTGPATTYPIAYSFGAGYKFTVVGFVNGETVDSENRWWKVNDGTYVWVGATIEKPASTPPNPTPPPPPPPPPPQIYICQYCGAAFTSESELNAHLLVCPKKPAPPPPPQEYWLYGMVVDSNTRNLLSGVKINAFGVASATTNSNGYYEIKFTQGYYGQVTASKDGYKTATQYVELAYPSKAVNFYLEPIVSSGYPKQVTLGWNANVRTAPNTQATIVKVLPAGSTFTAIAEVQGESVDGNSKWYKTSEGYYIWSGAEKVTTPTPPEQYKCPYCGMSFASQADLNAHMQVCPEKPKSEYPKQVTLGWNANVRTAPNRQATIIKVLPAGSTFTAIAEVEGENVDGNSKWYKTSDGYYIWSGAETERGGSGGDTTPLQKYVCPWCGQEFGTKEQLTEHMEKCPKKPVTTGWIIPALAIGALIFLMKK